jgi:hypothetical protein
VVLVIRGTCEQFRFKTPYRLSQIKTIRINFWQPGNENAEIVKGLADCVEDATSKKLIVTLNQVETLAFNTDSKGFVQFRGLTNDGFAFGSKEKPFTVYPVRDDTVLE